jgi:hypothetical protein
MAPHVRKSRRFLVQEVCEESKSHYGKTVRHSNQLKPLKIHDCPINFLLGMAELGVALAPHVPKTALISVHVEYGGELRCYCGALTDRH